ncbi:MAG: tetratricopeptide repeat protein, partial [Bacteroidota bacterium]
EARYRRARDLDQLRFRAPSAFNEVIRRLADEYGATLVDVEDRLAEADGGVIGAGMMLEHLHPTLGGYALMTDAFSEALGASARAGAEYALTPAYTQLDSLAGDLRIRRLMGGWPFQPLGTENRALDTLRLRTEPERLARELIDQEGLWERHTRRLMQWHNERRQTAEIARTGLALAQAFPFDHQAPFIAASALAQAGQREEALRWAERSSDVRPSAASELLIGNLLLDQGAIDDAIPRLQAAINIGGDSEEPLFRLGTALVFAGDFERAGPVLNRLLVLNPGHEGGRELLKAISG